MTKRKKSAAPPAIEPAPAAPTPPEAPPAPPSGRATQTELDALHGAVVRTITALLTSGEPSAALLGVAARVLNVTETRAAARELDPEDRLAAIMPDFDALERGETAPPPKS